MNKYELIKIPEGHELYATGVSFQIRALRDIPGIGVKKGDLGGYVHDECNLSQHGDCWIFDNSKMFSNSRMFENSVLRDSSRMYNHSSMHGDSVACNNSAMYDDSVMCMSGEISGTTLEGNTVVGVAALN